VLVVANKMDMIDKTKIAEPETYESLESQRNVLGLNGDFKGRDSHYDYHVSQVSAGHQSITCMVAGDHWTNDGSYLTSVRHSEDSSLPSREMVILWCMRNGLKHVEVSALQGSGIEEAVDTLVALALEARLEEVKQGLYQEPRSRDPSENDIFFAYRANEELDLLARYPPKNRTWCGLPPFNFCCE